MIGGVPRPRPPHLQRARTRHGNYVWYVRVGKGPRHRVDGEYGTPEFMAAYDRAHKLALTGARPTTTNVGPAADSLAWLIARYRESAAWLQELGPATRRQRENIFKIAIGKSGTVPYRRIVREDIEAARDERAATPHQARHFVDAFRGLFRWAKKAKYVPVDPTEGVNKIKTKSGKGFIPWTEEDVTAYRARWPLGTRQRVWMETLLCTGLRRGDAYIFGKQHIRNVKSKDGRDIKLGFLATEKSGKKTVAIFPITPEFEEAVAAGPCGELAFICTEGGKQFGSKESFGNEFSDACRAAGVPGSAHGLRKLAANRAVEKGATTAQLRAMFGWTTDAMPSLYTKDADRLKLAMQGAEIVLPNDTGTSMPSPFSPVRASEQKAK